MRWLLFLILFTAFLYPQVIDAPAAPPKAQVKFVPYDVAPVPLTAITPVYPEAARSAKVEGTVILQAFINETGEVTELQVLKGVDSGLDEAAAAAVKSTKFSPAKQGDRAVAVWISIPIEFRLSPDSEKK